MHRFRLPSTTQHGNLPFNQQHEDAFRFDPLLLLRWLLAAGMYFATLTEVPILQGLINNGMGQGPALALLLAGPALSLPNMLVIRSVMGTKKTVVFVLLVVVMATISGLLFGSFA